MMGRRFLLGTVSVALTLCVTLGLAEGICRLLPVRDSMAVSPVDAADPVLHFEPDRDVTWSRGWNFSIVNHLHVNAQGWVAEEDYTADGPRPLTAVIGDSFVEAAMVPPDETLQARLAQAQPEGRVQTFAASGAPLSQYLVWARHARDTYGPDRAVVVVVANDFDESLTRFKRAPGFHAFDETGALVRFDYAPTMVQRVARSSALVRYLVLNLEVLQIWNRLKNGGAPARDFVGNVPRSYSPERTKKARWAADWFLEQAPEAAGLPPERIALVVDGFRTSLYRPDRRQVIEGSYFEGIRDYFIEQARSAGFTVVDLAPVFADAWERDHRPFEYRTDGHWNGYAHALAAEAVAGTGFLIARP